MSYTYDPEALSTELNRIRLEIGDTNSNEYFLHDEEIAQIQSEESTFFKRVTACCRLICSKLARETRHAMDGFSEDSERLYEHYKEMAIRYGSVASGSYPCMMSTHEDDKDANEEDDNIVQGRFIRGMHDNP
jgi:t-SNARE complex subunit (syntaxin)